MMMQRQRIRFGSNDSSSSDLHLPLTNSASASALNVERPETPPHSGGYAIDVARMVPGRACSSSIVRQRSALSLSPNSKVPPRKAVSMFFTSSTCNNSSSSTSSSTSSNGSDHSDTGTNGNHNSSYSSYPSHHHHQLPIYATNANSVRSLSPPIGSRRRPSYSSNGSHSHWNHHNWTCAIVSVMGLVVMAVLAASSYQHNASLTMELTYRETEIEMHLDHARNLEHKVNDMRSETIHLHHRIEELEHEMSQPTQEELYIQRQVFHLEHAQEQVRRGVQETAKRMLQEIYGPGPKYYIELKLLFHPDSNIVQDATTEIDTTIVLETADIHDMPHTVFFFLEQVRHGIYDTTAFFRNAPGLVEAGLGHDRSKLVELEKSSPSLAHLLFTSEHSRELQHTQYTLGFRADAAATDFYVNMQDNSEQRATQDEARTSTDAPQQDPCFARIVRGFNTMERIHRSNVRDEELSFRRKQYSMVHQVMIESMTILQHGYDPEREGHHRSVGSRATS
ncbi:expressed unknown protein [Seminavis robusta]|uniref:PPIase cyclophilin-type domain-containing protein n=1 Tax=Seminavis robusta TaxID=568900 RepID=A0A9N8EG18_9STRA|nr:expressed unknown protein [Seminavis robusta]|eukprot:Sro1041_g234620.1 n/a (507) ;mRNA; f:33681-35293